MKPYGNVELVLDTNEAFLTRIIMRFVLGPTDCKEVIGHEFLHELNL